MRDMQNQNRSRSLLFMTELILAIFFFSAASAVCLQAYALAASRNQQARRLKQALNCTENLVQQLRSGGYDALEELCEGADAGEDSAGRLYFDADGNSCEKKDADYYITVETYTQDGAVYADLESCDSSGGALYELQAALYPDGGAGE